MNAENYMKEKGITEESLDKLSGQYEQANFPHLDSVVYSGSHLDAVGKKRVTVVYEASTTQKVLRIAQKRGIKPSEVYRDALDYYLEAQEI